MNTAGTVAIALVAGWLVLLPRRAGFGWPVFAGLVTVLAAEVTLFASVPSGLAFGAGVLAGALLHAAFRRYLRLRVADV